MIGLAIIGLGAALGPHAKALLDLRDRAQVVHAVARNPERQRAAAEAYGFPVSGDAMAAIADPRVDAVMILTPTNAHLELAGTAFAAGRHVLCEKPLDVTIERAERLVLLGVGLAFDILVPVLWVMLALTALTAVQRFVKVWRQATPSRARRTRHPRNPGTDEPRAGSLGQWWASRRPYAGQVARRGSTPRRR